MILYKYVCYKAGQRILSGSSIGFACPGEFNDPFELSGYPHQDGTDPVAGYFADIANWAKRNAWLDNCAILSLTRSPLNPLMWAHYADAHRGFVIGFDALAAGFAEATPNLVPAQFGSVIYTNRRPQHEIVTNAIMRIGEEYSFRHDIYEKLQRLFLYKPICWSYEEEVRVVKCVHGIEGNNILPSGTFTIYETDDRKLFLVTLPENAVKEVYLGVRNPSRKRNDIDSLASVVRERNPNVKISRCVVGSREWTLEMEGIG